MSTTSTISLPVSPQPQTPFCDGPDAGAQVDLAFVHDAVKKCGKGGDAVIPILQSLQDHYHYLPTEALKRVCELSEITPAQITGVASFYMQFRHSPCGEHLVRVCNGTACHVRGSELVRDALHHHLKIPAGNDTSGDRRFTVENVACLGCCTLAPVVQIGQATYGHLVPGGVGDMLRDFEEQGRLVSHGNGHGLGVTPENTGQQVEFRVGLGSCCMVKGSDTLMGEIEMAVKRMGAPAQVKRVGCVGMCHQTPIIEVRRPRSEPTLYAGVRPGEGGAIVRRHLKPRGWHRAKGLWGSLVDSLVVGGGVRPKERHPLHVRDPHVSAFLGPQVRIATEHFGTLDPLDLDEYMRHEGFKALRVALDAKKPESLIETVTQSGLRGRGGAGFPTGIKWQRVRAATGDPKYVICNGDEGDPGAFMDRMILESFPYRVIEGMALAALAVGSRRGFFYIRAEYPLAVERVTHALAECRRRGILGENVLGSGWSLELEIKQGAGAFVCGEETALIASIEGQRGIPRLRPPYPAESGLWGQPTCVNNVETLALLPWIIRHGAPAFSAYGTATSKGTKVFALAGKVARGGLIEVPMGVTLRQIVEDIGGGAGGGKKWKAVQIGGPSGGCIPASLADTPVDYEALSRLGAIMGSGGLVVLDETDCMVDIARYFLAFTQDQSCGKCTFCRVGTRRMLDILERLCQGKARPNDLAELEQLAGHVQAGSLCGLGKTAPNPVLSTLRYFRDEYEAHLHGKCPAGRCRPFIGYYVNDACTGCTLCAQHCPDQAIEFTPFRRHHIDLDKCTRCDTCRNVCPVAGANGSRTGGAIDVR